MAKRSRGSQRVRPARLPPPGPSWRGEPRRILWDLWQGPNNSFGLVTMRMLQALHALGVEVAMIDGPPETRLDPALVRILSKGPAPARWGVRHTAPSSTWRMPTEHQLRYTMWEWTELPKGWADNVNRLDQILAVPSHQQKELFQSQGVRVPVAVVGHGVDQAPFHARPPRRSRWFTFGTMGFLSERKGTDVLLQAFADEFAGQEDVRLVIKTSPDPGHQSFRPLIERLGLRAPRLEVISQHLTEEALGRLLGSFDVGVFPSRGEGFGLGGLECMAVGRSVICTRWGGMAEYLDPAYNYALDCGFEAAPEMSWTRLYGADFKPSWARPSYEHLRALMRHCYEHPGEVRAKGKAAAGWVRARWTWERAARQLLEAIDGYIVAPPGHG